MKLRRRLRQAVESLTVLVRTLDAAAPSSGWMTAAIAGGGNWSG